MLVAKVLLRYFGLQVELTLNWVRAGYLPVPPPFKVHSLHRQATWTSTMPCAAKVAESMSKMPGR